jgi:hypothetical protein
MIDAYLSELRRALGLWPTGRLLAEVEDHLRELAGEVGEAEAVERFGDARELAKRYRPVVALQRSVVLTALALAFPIAQYPLVENSLPPAPWPSAEQMPAELVWKLEAILWLLPLAFVAGVVAVIARRRAPRVFVAALAAVLASLASVAVLGSVLAVDWHDRVPWAPPALQLLGPAHLVIVVAAAVELLRGARLSNA